MAGKIRLSICLLGLFCTPSAFASSTVFVARVQSVLPDGTMRCEIARFVRVDPEEVRRIKRGTKNIRYVDVTFNEISLPRPATYRRRAVSLLRHLTLGRKVTVSLGLPAWDQGKVIADVELTGSSDSVLPLVLIKKGLACYKSTGDVTDDVLSDAEEIARASEVGMWAKERSKKH